MYSCILDKGMTIIEMMYLGSVSQYGTNISDTDVPAVLEMCRNTNLYL